MTYLYTENRVDIYQADSMKDQLRIGIHLNNPTLLELLDAQEQAERDNFARIILHDANTWPGDQE